MHGDSYQAVFCTASFYKLPYIKRIQIYLHFRSNLNTPCHTNARIEHVRNIVIQVRKYIQYMCHVVLRLITYQKIAPNICKLYISTAQNISIHITFHKYMFYYFYILVNIVRVMISLYTAVMFQVNYIPFNYDTEYPFSLSFIISSQSFQYCRLDLVLPSAGILKLYIVLWSLHQSRLLVQLLL